MIGIIGAMASEVDGLKELMENKTVDVISGVEFCCGSIGGKNIVVAQAGVGKVNAAVTAQTMILKYNTKAIINIGVAGGINPTLNIGDIVIADRTVEHDMDTTAVGDAPGFITGIDRVYMDCDKEISELMYQVSKDMGIHTIYGVVASGDIFVSGDSVRNKIANIFNGAAAEMEGGAIGHVCTMNNVPFAVLRAMSDCANNDSVVDFPAFAQKAAKTSIEIITEFLKRYKG